MKRVYITKNDYIIIGSHYSCPFRDQHAACEQCTIGTELDCNEDFPSGCRLEDAE